MIALISLIIGVGLCIASAVLVYSKSIATNLSRINSQCGQPTHFHPSTDHVILNCHVSKVEIMTITNVTNVKLDPHTILSMVEGGSLL